VQALELVTKYPSFLRINPNDGALEMFLDHHSLSSFRMCEAKFVEEILNQQHPRGARYWALEFGLWVHDCLALFYDAFKRTKNPPIIDDWVKQCIALWDAYDLDFYKPDPLKLAKQLRTDEKKHKSFGGREGAAAFLIHYYAFYMNQRFSIVATEVSFGRRLEVLLGEFTINNGTPRYDEVREEIQRYAYYLWESCNYDHGHERDHWLFAEQQVLARYAPFKVRCYLTGRIDLLVDNGYKIGPVDHKTTGTFDGYEANDFDPHEGITGYIYTTNHILGTEFPNELHKICRDGWIFHISTNATDAPRFKATPIVKTPQQLEDFRLRQVSTCKSILDVLISWRVANWNTNICNNIYNRPCPYHELHRQPLEQREAMLKQFYEIRPAWDAEFPPDHKKNKKEEPTIV
jgi:hypothetical protein